MKKETTMPIKLKELQADDHFKLEFSHIGDEAKSNIYKVLEPSTETDYYVSCWSYESNRKINFYEDDQCEKTSLEAFAKEMLNDEDVDFDEFYNFVSYHELGWGDGVNSDEIIREYVTRGMQDRTSVSHILKAIEEYPSERELYEMDLENSTNTPKAIRNKQDLYDALEIKEMATV